MLARFLTRLHLSHIDRDLVFLAFINGISGMALSGAAIFGMLAVLSGTAFLHGLSGLACYLALSGSATFIGYVSVCRYVSVLGLKIRTVLYAVFVVHALGFVGAAFIHPICVALSAGMGLGIFYAVFMLKSMNGINDKDRDGYATINGLIQQSTILLTPFLGAATLYLGARMGFTNVFLPSFLTFAFCALLALPLIHRIPNAPLPYSVVLPIKKVADKKHLPAIFMYLVTISCEGLMYPLLILASFSLLGKVVEVGWFSAAITVVAFLSLILSHQMRLPGQRWIILGGALVGIGCGFVIFDLSFTFASLLLAGALFALCRVNYVATWFAFSSRMMENEWGHFGKTQALVLGEVFVMCGRLCVAFVILVCASWSLSFKESLFFLTFVYLLCATASLLTARFIDRKYGSTLDIMV